MKGEYDVHVATEGLDQVDSLMEKFELLGYKDDRLTSRRVTYLRGIPLSSCPLIGVHMTKKEFEDITEVREDMDQLYDIVQEAGVQGYAHAEFTRDGEDIFLSSDKGFRIVRPWPVKRLEAKLRKEGKIWDFHIAMPTDNTPEELETTFNEAGLYWMEILKNRDGEDKVFRVYTIQGINRVNEARVFMREIEKWMRDCHVPHAEMKLELTTNMWRIGSPRIVPPTIDQINYVEL